MGAAVAAVRAKNPGTGAGPQRRGQLVRASKARAVMSSTEPVPLMARYLGAVAGSALAQAE